MKVFFVGAGPGDPDMLTVKAHRLLSNCSCCVYAGSLVSPEIIDLIPPRAQSYDSAAMSLGEITAVFRRAQKSDTDVIRLHTGDPTIYSAIGEQISELNTLGIQYEIIPGISSFQAAASAVGVELTVPEIAQTVILTRMAGRTPVPAEQSLERLAASQATLCIFLSVQKLDTAANILARHYGDDCPVAVIYRASWPDERVITGLPADIAAKVEKNGIRKTAMIIAGPALKRPDIASKLYDASFSHEYRKGDER